ncbi:ParB/RepB/Spo0J family partition protein [Allochromatium tepidum]|uniref:ParB/Sulfiredoxin domain-containing protein n=1 Tax=Allochromatium tepidum TaxID=553982 RepID=A0ABN6GEM4_9GAMM|nr:hypothetical protein [Allochromatium tepidum]BCU08407.1 hypothetical protein Atep_30840 [Allochromatium tepidum]
MHQIQTLRLEYIDLPAYWPWPPGPAPRQEALRFAEESGLIDPVIVRSVGNPGFPRYELLSGRDSLELARHLFRTDIPAVILDLTLTEAQEFVRVFNAEEQRSPEATSPIGRRLLTIVDEIQSKMGELAQRHIRYTWRQAAKEYGVSPALLSHGCRLQRRLHPVAKEALKRGGISLGHAKALTRFRYKEQPRIVARILERGASVRDIEQSARRRALGAEDGLSEGLIERDPNALALEQAIAEQRGWKARLAYDAEQQRGTLTLEFQNLDILDDILEKMGVDLDR